MWKKRLEIKRNKDKIEAAIEDIPRKTFERAINLLSYKARSIKELKERLLEKDCATEAVVDDVIEKLKYYNYLNDDQFALDTASFKIRRKPMGKKLLRMKLQEKSLDKETIEKALDAAFEETPEAEIIDRAIEKRLRLKGQPATREESKKFFDHLLRQGFGYDLVRDKVREIIKIDEDQL